MFIWWLCSSSGVDCQVIRLRKLSFTSSPRTKPVDRVCVNFQCDPGSEIALLLAVLVRRRNFAGKCPLRTNLWFPLFRRGRSVTTLCCACCILFQQEGTLNNFQSAANWCVFQFPVWHLMMCAAQGSHRSLSRWAGSHHLHLTPTVCCKATNCSMSQFWMITGKVR